MLKKVYAYAGYIEIELDITPLAELPAQTDTDEVEVIDEYFRAWDRCVEERGCDTELY